MSTSVKSFLVAGVLISWIAAFFMQKIFAMDAFSLYFYVAMFAVFLCWLTPFSLLVLFCKERHYVLMSFLLGAAGFFILSQSLYAFIALTLLGLGFLYWQRQAQSFISNTRIFSLYATLQGFGLFLTTLSLFIAFFYFDSPFGKSVSFEPKIPQNIYDFVYNQVSGSSFFQTNTKAPSVFPPEKLKSMIYEEANDKFKKFTQQYIAYIPIVFAAGLFLALKGFFAPFKYLLLFVVFLMEKLLIALGVLKKQIIRVDKEIIEF